MNYLILKAAASHRTRADPALTLSLDCESRSGSSTLWQVPAGREQSVYSPFFICLVPPS